MNDAPAGIEAGVIDQPLDRARAQRRDAVGDFLRLLGGMDVDRS
jgi:hypothetical protein